MAVVEKDDRVGPVVPFFVSMLNPNDIRRVVRFLAGLREADTLVDLCCQTISDRCLTEAEIARLGLPEELQQLVSHHRRTLDFAATLSRRVI